MNITIFFKALTVVFFLLPVIGKCGELDDILSTRFSKEEIDIIKRQHPALDVHVAHSIFQVLEEECSKKTPNPKELLSLFTLHAAILVGFEVV